MWFLHHDHKDNMPDFISFRGEPYIVLEALGALPIDTLTDEGGQHGVRLDLGGHINLSDPQQPAEQRFLMAPGQAIELAAELLANVADVYEHQELTPGQAALRVRVELHKFMKDRT